MRTYVGTVTILNDKHPRTTEVKVYGANLSVAFGAALRKAKRTIGERIEEAQVSLKPLPKGFTHISHTSGK